MAAFILSLLSGLWTRVSGWAVLVGALVAALGIAWLRGRAAGKASWEARRAQVREKAQRQSGDIRHDIQTGSDAALDRRLDRWMRD